MFLRAVLVAGLAVSLVVGPAPAQTSNPNVLVFFTDDLGFSDLGCYGGEIQTPNRDALAKNGLRYSQFYNTARCWPSRSPLLSGYYAQQVRMDPPGKTPPPWLRLLSHHLAGRGYLSYHSGKRHVMVMPRVLADVGFLLSSRRHRSLLFSARTLGKRQAAQATQGRLLLDDRDRRPCDPLSEGPPPTIAAKPETLPRNTPTASAPAAGRNSTPNGKPTRVSSSVDNDRRAQPRQRRDIEIRRLTAFGSPVGLPVGGSRWKTRSV